jgi:hypothetical protein
MRDTIARRQVIHLGRSPVALRVPLHMYQEARRCRPQGLAPFGAETGGTYSAFNPAVPQTIERLAAQLNEVARAAVASVLAIETNRT